MRCTIIGAGGFIGSALAEYMVTCGDEVVGIDPQFPTRWNPAAEFRQVKLPAADLQFSAGTQAVVYLAQSSAYRDFPRQATDLFSVNMLGAIQACAAARAAGAACFIYASTGNVYAPSFAPRAEDAPVRRDEAYALSKVMAEEALALLHPQPRLIIARLFGVFGPGQRTMLPTVLRQRIERDEPILLHPAPGEGESTGGLRISFAFVGDVVRRLRDLAAQAVGDQPVPQVVNLAGPEPLSLRQFATALARGMGRQARFEVQPTPRPLDLWADIERLNTLCPYGFTPFDAAIEATLR